MSNIKNNNTEPNAVKNGALNERQKAAGMAGGKELKDKADAFALGLKPLLKELEEQGLTGRTAIANAFSARNIPTARGGQWTVTAVTNLIGRLAVIKVEANT
ncbi:MAG: hypothetical protein V4484_19835 [Pseudomonadota bacterium]